MCCSRSSVAGSKPPASTIRRDTPPNALATRSATALTAASRRSGVMASLLGCRRRGEPAHAAHLDPFVMAHRLNREAGVVYQHHPGELAIVLDASERHRSGQVDLGTDIDAFPAGIVAAAFGMSRCDDADDADDVEPRLRMVEETEVADLHATHVVAGLVVAHAIPLRALGAQLLQLSP